MFSFWFGKNVSSERQTADSKLDRFYDGDRGLGDLHGNAAELRVWVPEPLMKAMKQVAERLQKPLSQHLRNFLVVYLYGEHELLYMHDHHVGIFHPPPATVSEGGDAPRFSRAKAVECIPGLGKNIVPLKLFLHEKLKSDLQVLADNRGIPLSQFAREILVSHFLGHAVWPERKHLWTTEQQGVADRWVSGQIEGEFLMGVFGENAETLDGRIENLD